MISGRTHLNGAKFGTPEGERVDTNAIGRGTMALVNILYASLRIQTGFRMCVYVCEDADPAI